jgi:hypothetical protein
MTPTREAPIDVHNERDEDGDVKEDRRGSWRMIFFYSVLAIRE